jgi:osmotically-inducible protein OsmY
MMQKAKLALAVAALITALPLLQGCVPAVVTGATVATMSAYDRRSTGIQTDDESAEWKAGASVPEQYKETAHVNFTAYNRRLLITGEVPTDDAKRIIGDQAARVAGIREVINETVVGPATSMSVRSNDSYLTSKVKARLVDAKEVSAFNIKVVTENGTTYLLGIVTEREAAVAATVASRTEGVRKVVKVFEVVSDTEAKRLDTLPNPARSDAPPPPPKPPAQPAPVENR